jgi:putative membrane protein
MKALVFGLMASIAVGGAYAQTATTPNAPMGSGTAAASGDSNQAVATTHANAPMPAKGANSFTMSEARSRIANNGFTNVSGLTKDTDGVWRGHADKDGTNAAVWLDYKGNVGTN